MTFLWTGSALSLWAAALVSVVTAGAAWRLRLKSPGGRHFTAMMVGIVIWCFAAGMEAAAVGIETKVLLAKLGYIGVCAVAPFFFSFAFAYCGKPDFLNRLRRAALWTIPVATLLLVFTNGWHHLVWSGFAAFTSAGQNMLLYRHGPWFWVWVFYAAVVTCAATAVLVQSALSCERFYLRQAFVFLAGAAMPWVGTGLYLSPVSPVPGLDFPSLGFALSGGLLLLGMSRFRLFDIVPVARIDVVQCMSEGLVVLDGADRIVDINPAAQKMLGLGSEAIGAGAQTTLPAMWDILSSARERDGARHLELPGLLSRHVDLVVTPLTRGQGTSIGRVLVLRDAGPVNEGGLPAGLVPMCASCRKVRDQAGGWQSLEQYVEDHSDLRFSHGLCDDCVSRLYPEIDMGNRPKRP